MLFKGYTVIHNSTLQKKYLVPEIFKRKIAVTVISEIDGGFVVKFLTGVTLNQLNNCTKFDICHSFKTALFDYI